MVARKTLLLTLLTLLVAVTFLVAQTTGSSPKIAITGVPHAGQGGTWTHRRNFWHGVRPGIFVSFASSFTPTPATNGGSSRRPRIR